MIVDKEGDCLHIGIRIKRKREELKLTQDELAKLLGYKSKSTINKIELGINDITQSKIALFAKVLHTTPAFLMGWTDGSVHEQRPKGVKIPVLGRVQAGIPIDAIEEVLDYEEISEQMARSGEFFALRIHGNSMEPRIYEGDVVIVKRQPDVDSGEIAIVLVNGNDATCKKVVKQSNGISLVALNPQFEPIFYTWQEIEYLPVTVLGKVVELRGKF